MAQLIYTMKIVIQNSISSEKQFQKGCCGDLLERMLNVRVKILRRSTALHVITMVPLHSPVLYIAVYTKVNSLNYS